MARARNVGRLCAFPPEVVKAVRDPLPPRQTKLSAPVRPAPARLAGRPGMQCPWCQAENREGARFCRQCGATFGAVCSSCGAKVEAGSKFCDGCRAPLAATPVSGLGPSRFASPESYTPKHLAEKILTSKTALEGERKQVTVLFADLKGSMELLADRDPEEARKLLDPVLERRTEAVHRYEGTVNQVMGDGIMALFGAPLAHEDHAGGRAMPPWTYRRQCAALPTGVILGRHPRANSGCMLRPGDERQWAFPLVAWLGRTVAVGCL